MLKCDQLLLSALAACTHITSALTWQDRAQLVKEAVHVFAVALSERKTPTPGTYQRISGDSASCQRGDKMVASAISVRSRSVWDICSEPGEPGGGGAVFAVRGVRGPPNPNE